MIAQIGHYEMSYSYYFGMNYLAIVKLVRIAIQYEIYSYNFQKLYHFKENEKVRVYKIKFSLVR